MTRFLKEWKLFKTHWHIILFSILFQFIHKLCVNIVYVFHRPGLSLPDIGFYILPKLPNEYGFLSEIMFLLLIICTVIFSFAPLFGYFNYMLKKKSSTVLIYSRFGIVLVISEFLRCISFLSTSLPGPGYHCSIENKNYFAPQLNEIFTYSSIYYNCGDLIFSGHIMFMICCFLTFHKYSCMKFKIKLYMMLYIILCGILIISLRKHYTIDIVVALYTVPMVWICYDKYFPD